MHVLLPNCCFCGKVRDDEGREVGQGDWIDVETYRARHHVIPDNLWLSPTYCDDCKAKRSFNRARNVS